jgi:hypothetical protein
MHGAWINFCVDPALPGRRSVATLVVKFVSIGFCPMEPESFIETCVLEFPKRFLRIGDDAR